MILISGPNAKVHIAATVWQGGGSNAELVEDELVEDELVISDPSLPKQDLCMPWPICQSKTHGGADNVELTGLALTCSGLSSGWTPAAD